MWNWYISLHPEDQLKGIALLGASIAFTFGLLQYRKSQRWKRAEWVAQEMSSFFNDTAVKTALQLMDWGSRRVKLYPDRLTSSDRFILVRDDDLAKALALNPDHPEPFTAVEADLRDLVDHYLDRLERINSFVDSRLVSVHNVRPYLNYWAQNLIDAVEGDPKVDRLMQLRCYIRYYGFAGVEALFVRITRSPFPQDSKAGTS